MGRERTLTLLYNSRTAYYRPIITAAVTQPAGLVRPSAVYVQLDVAGVNRKSGTYDAWNDSTRQIAISYDAPGLGQGTGVYPFTLQVQNQYAGGGAWRLPLTEGNRTDCKFGAYSSQRDAECGRPTDGPAAARGSARCCKFRP